MRLIIKGGKVVNDDCSQHHDIYIEDGTIKMMGNNLVIPGGARVIDAKGKLIMPGGIDASTHLNPAPFSIPSADDFYSGTKGALAGGTTMIFDYVVPEVNQSLVEAFTKCHETAAEKVCCDFALHVCLTWWSDKVSQEMEVLVKEKGVNSFHLDMAKPGGGWLDKDLMQILRRCKELRVMLMVHAENAVLVEEKLSEVLSEMKISGPEGHGMTHPEEAETQAAYHVISMASLSNSPILLTNFTSVPAAEVISESRRKGKIVFSGVPIAALVLTGSECLNASWSHAASHLTTPPLRMDSSTPDTLTCLLANDDIQMVTSEHCSYDVSQRALGKDDFSKVPKGVNGVQERMLMLWKQAVLTGRMDMNRFVATTSTNPAKLFNLYPKKGKISVGSDADLVIWDADMVTKISSKETQKHKGDFNVYEGQVCIGGPCMVITAGSVVMDQDGQFRVTQGYGQYVSLPPNCDHVFTRVAERDKLCRTPKVTRAAYTGPSFEGVKVEDGGDGAAIGTPVTDRGGDEFHSRGTRSGTRHQQDSSFSFSGAQADDDKGQKRSMKVSQPPGGKSSGLW